MTGGAKDPAERIADGGSPAVADMKGTGGVGADEFEKNLGSFSEVAFAVGVRLLQHRPEARNQKLRLEVEIQKTGLLDPNFLKCTAAVR